MSRQDKFWTTGRATRVIDNDSEVSCVYHNTEVFHWNKQTNIVTLRSGGYLSVTTKTRMNQCSSYWLKNQFSVYQRKHQWYVSIDGLEMLYNDNMELHVTAPYVESYDDGLSAELATIY